MIPLFAANASGNTVIQLDDPSLDTDVATDIVPRMLTAAFDLGRTGGWATLRHVAQLVSIANTGVTMTITPWADGVEYAAQSVDHQLDELECICESDFDVSGTRFQLGIELSDLDGEVSLGSSDQDVIPRRRIRS